MTIICKENALPEEIQAIRQGVLEEATLAGMGETIPFTLLIKDENAQVVSGATGHTMYNYLFVDWLWVHRSHRNKGWGSKLLCAAENLGKERKCNFSCLFTMSWEALSFYQKHGYQIEYVREGFEKDAKMYLLRKSLNS